MNKIIKIPVLILFLSVMMFSCQNETTTEKEEEPTAETSSSEELKDEVAKNSDLKYNPAHGVEGHRCDLPVGAPLEQATSNTNQQMTESPLRLKSATPRINPPHGEPGHDCSVAVGAPLN